MPKQIEYEGQIHEFPDDFTDADIKFALSNYTQPKPQPPQVNMTQAPLDVLKGVGKGVLSTGAHAADIVQRMAGTPRILERPEVQSLITPANPWESAGYALEKGGEFMLPGGLVNRGVGAVQAATAGVPGANLLSLATRAGLEGVSAGGVAGLQTGGDPKAMQEAALMGAAVPAGLGAVRMGAQPIANLLERSALTQYGRVLNPTKQATKYLSQTQVAPGLIERGVMAGSMKGLEGKAGAQVQKFGQAIGDAWSNVPSGTSIELGPVLTNLDQSLDDLFVTTSRGKVPKGPFAEQASQNVDKLKQTLSDVAEINPTTGLPEIPVDRLRDVRQYFDDIAAQAGRYDGKTLAEKSMAEAHGKAADAIRNELAKQFPDIAKINKEYNFWKNAQQVIEETVRRREGQARPLGRKLVSAAGAAAGMAQSGPVGLLLGKVAGDQFEALITSPAWGTISAVAKDRLAKALASGNKGAILFYLKQMSRTAPATITIPSSKELPLPIETPR